MFFHTAVKVVKHIIFTISKVKQNCDKAKVLKCTCVFSKTLSIQNVTQCI